jgi:hypothetical protein
MRNAAQIVLGVLLCFMTACDRDDPIDKIVATARKDSRFGGGMFFPIKVSENTTPLDVAAKTLGESSTNLVILSEKRVEIAVDNQETIAPGTTSYRALFVTTKQSGDKVVLMRFDKRMRWWWSRAYDVKP